tara:strand:- start:1132 stop:1377 length:246 start_codon:yes stop_codon:yes gene_type:complete
MRGQESQQRLFRFGDSLSMKVNFGTGLKPPSAQCLYYVFGKIRPVKEFAFLVKKTFRRALAGLHRRSPRLPGARGRAGLLI